jgi:hypothetical protein
MSGELERKAVEMLEKLEGLAVEHAPEALEIAAATARVTAIGNIITGFIFVAIAGLIGFGTYTFARYSIKKSDEGGYLSDWGFLGFFGCLAGGGSTFVAVAIGLPHVLQVWNWVALLDPKLAIAARVLGYY